MRRPDQIDLGKASNGPNPSIVSPRSFQLDLPSPRVGDVPPALSPLDAFAQQSRMLAKRFEESQQAGRRLSRLDHTEVANQLGRQGLSYFRSPLDDLDSEDHRTEDDLPDLPLLPRTGPPTPRQPNSPPRGPGKPKTYHNLTQHRPSTADRPVSHYPHFSDGMVTPVQERYDNNQQPHRPTQQQDGYFGFQGRRANSPEPIDVLPQSRSKPDVSPRVPSLTGSADSAPSTQRTNTDDSLRTDSGLAPPRSAVRFPRSPRSNVSIRSFMDGPDDEIGQQRDLAPPRKVSNGSAISGRRSPLGYSHLTHTPRSPSNMSETSADSEYRRPSFNFSRPLSGGSAKQWSDGRPSLSSRPSHDSNMSSFEFPQRKLSIEKARSPLRQESGSTVNSPRIDLRLYDVSTPADEITTPMLEADGTPGATSYIYSKFSLPRGRTVDRSSTNPQDSWMTNAFQYDGLRPKEMANDSPILSPSEIPKSAVENRGRPFQQALELNKSRSRSADAQGPPTPRNLTNFHKSSPSSPSVTSASTDRTVKAHRKNSASGDIASMSPEQHLEEGIQSHNNGSLNKSTYHLRLAARGGLPTAMLLYALACRHGWGMRPNQQEGIVWLKKAVDSTSLDLITNDKAISKVDIHSPATKKDANFALAVYELGMSYMNGWGIPKDKALALRCFEIAGAWGDCDALAEAGFCYTQGVGCKKDLKKAAGYYRRAAEGGMSMAGNSWIYKDKYKDSPAPAADSPQPSPNPSAAPTGRSRAKSLFGRKNKT